MPRDPNKDDRLYAPFPIEMDEHPKIIGLSDAAFRAIFEATFYSRRMLSDGFLDERIVLRKWGQEVADELSANDPERPSWIRVERGWQIHDFEKHHPLRAEIEVKREAKREAGRLGGMRSGEVRRSKTEANAKQNASTGERNRTPETETESKTETTTPKGVEGTLSPFCRYHPDGTDKPCKGCGNARLKFEASWDSLMREKPSTPSVPDIRAPKTCPTHLNYPIPCSRCAEGDT